MNNWFKQNSSHIFVFLLFFAICFVYFYPAFSGKTIGQNDVTRAQSTQTEINQYKEKGETILWTNQIHGGMPTFQIWAPYPANITTWIIKGINAIFPNPIGTVLLLLAGTYLLFCVVKLNPWLAAAGAIAFTFSSYNIILITAGHANQVFAIAFFAPVLAGILLIFRGKYSAGIALTALFLALEIRANHIQMTYYLLLAILILVGIETYHAFKSKTFQLLARSIAFAGVATLIAIAVNASSLWSTYDYGKDTIRGKSNLTAEIKESGKGLSKAYAYQWSQGVGECITFLIPNAYGGSSRGNAQQHEHVVKSLTDIGADPSQATYIAQNIGSSYWGEKPFTEGSFYFGAVVCFLFVLGLFIVKNKMKWWLLAVVLLTMLLSFGKNFPFVSDLFFDYFPLYNKFRAVESILAVAGLCFPMLALLAAQELTAATDRTFLLKKAKHSLYITGGLSLLVAIIPDVFLSFKSSNHLDFVAQLAQMLKVDQSTANILGDALAADRKAAAQDDAIRSFIFIALAFALVWAFLKNKITATVLSLGFVALVLIDMWPIDKRYLNTGSFVERQDVVKPQPRAVDLQILKDPDPDYKVIDLTENILSDATTPYFHKSIGGYSAARLKKFDEVITVQFSKTINMAVLDMLNTKYIISNADTSATLQAQVNTTACGHAWFVSKVKYVKNADEEMKAITNFSPKDEAIVDQRFKSQIEGTPWHPGTASGVITLSSYAPDKMVYESNSTQANIAVFSEIYYTRGWKMFIDGVEKPYFSANYLVRAAQIPQGKHTIEFVFHPDSYYTGEHISLAGSALLILVLLQFPLYQWRRRKKMV
ncbi:hypothetical protein [Pedobacter duraquae]|uniref:Membrane protein YfhO n=1 Tax=Pedobacter duraquae TaxID=425511 RepID=A0A4R6IK69_9SPHI|nr:hypothetical protein [Pedobacter duraquae]TDO22449.1 hypothetical protein CLV32_1422 [Pedobacter duraquae]